MEVPGTPATASGSRRAFAGGLSIGIHGAALLVAVWIVAEHDRPPQILLTPIQVVDPPIVAPAAPAAPALPAPIVATAGSPLYSTASANSGTLGRRGRDAPKRSQTRAAAPSDPFADVTVSYDRAEGPDPGNEAGTTGLGVGAGLLGDGTGTGTGTGQFGVGNVPPPPPSLARPPRPRGDYKNWNFRADRRFAGATVLVELTIDPRGKVREVRVHRGVEESIDRNASSSAKAFEFFPALDDAGKPTWGRYAWEFVLLADGSSPSNW